MNAGLDPNPPLTARLWLARRLDSIAALIALSGVMNVAGALFIIYVYDKAIPEHSLASLALAFAAVVLVYAFQSALRFLARQKAEHVGKMFLAQFEPLALAATHQPSMSMEAEYRLVAIRRFARFLHSRRLIVVLDLIWMPFFLACLFYISLLIGLFSLAILIVLGLATRALQPDRPESRAKTRQRNGVHSPSSVRPQPATEHDATDQRGHKLRAFASALKNIAHSGVLAVGAWLVITKQLDVGELMASSMLMMRLFGPARALADEWPDLRLLWPLWLRLRDMEWSPLLATQPEEAAHPILPK